MLHTENVGATTTRRVETDAPTREGVMRSMRYYSWIIALFVGVFALTSITVPQSAFAQDDTEEVAAPVTDQSSIVVDKVIAGFMRDFSIGGSGAFIFQYMIVIILASGLAVAFERFYTIILKASRVNSKRFTEEVVSLVEKKNYDRAIQLCDQSPGGALPILTKAGLEAAKLQLGARAVQDAIDVETLKIMPEITRRLTWVSVLANIATLAGLMGTIYGLMFTFAGLSMLTNPKEKANVLASGIATAMNTTLFGLIVAIPLTLIFQYLNQASKALIDDIDENSVRLINALTKA